MQNENITDREAAWRRVKGQIIARFGSITACAVELGCAPQSLRMSILSDLLPGVREKLLAALNQPQTVAA